MTQARLALTTLVVAWTVAAVMAFGLASQTHAIEAKQADAKPAAGERATLKVFSGDYLSRPFGKMTITIGKGGVLVDIKARDTCLVARPPEWKVYTFNKRAKLIYEVPLERYSQLFPAAKGRAFVPIISKEPRKLANKDVTKLSYNVRQQYTEIMGTLDKRKSSMFTQQLDYKYIEVGAPAQAYKIINCLFAAPDYSQLFAGRVIFLTDGERIDYVTFVKGSETTVAPSFFAVPTGFKRVDDFNQVLTGQLADIEDMIRDMGVGETFGKH